MKMKATEADKAIIHKIARRAFVNAQKAATKEGYTLRFDELDIHMDITATHLNGCRLRLADLLAADEFNFAHDVLGINRHLNRETGKLGNHFLPRFSAPSPSRVGKGQTIKGKG